MSVPSYWINVHHPRAKTESEEESLRVYLPSKLKKLHNPIDNYWPMKRGDYAFIYESAEKSGKQMQILHMNNKRIISREQVILCQGVKAIIGLVKLKGFIYQEGITWIWDDDEYYGYFETYYNSETTISLDRIRSIINGFNPRRFGGIMKIKPFDFKLLYNSFLGDRSYERDSKQYWWDEETAAPEWL